MDAGTGQAVGSNWAEVPVVAMGAESRSRTSSKAHGAHGVLGVQVGTSLSTCACLAVCIAADPCGAGDMGRVQSFPAYSRIAFSSACRLKRRDVVVLAWMRTISLHKMPLLKRKS